MAFITMQPTYFSTNEKFQTNVNELFLGPLLHYDSIMKKQRREERVKKFNWMTLSVMELFFCTLNCLNLLNGSM